MERKTRILFSILGLTALIILTFSVIPVFSDQIIFGPKTYNRVDGPPQVITDNFSATAGSQYKLVLTNNGLTDSADESAADSFVYLNGENIAGVQNFSQSTQALEVPVTLQESNALEVEVRGAEGGSVTVLIVSNP